VAESWGLTGGLREGRLRSLLLDGLALVSGGSTNSAAQWQQRLAVGANPRQVIELSVKPRSGDTVMERWRETGRRFLNVAAARLCDDLRNDSGGFRRPATRRRRFAAGGGPAVAQAEKC